MEISGSENSKRSDIIRLIAAFRLAKALGLIAIGFGVLQLLHPETAGRVRDWLASLPFTSARHIQLTPKHIELAAIAAFAYAALFIVEGVGLWMQKVWAEYLTIVATTSFIPFEIRELIKKVTAVRAAALLINVAIVIYLVARRWRARD